MSPKIADTAAVQAARIAKSIQKRRYFHFHRGQNPEVVAVFMLPDLFTVYAAASGAAATR